MNCDLVVSGSPPLQGRPPQPYLTFLLPCPFKIFGSTAPREAVIVLSHGVLGVDTCMSSSDLNLCAAPPQHRRPPPTETSADLHAPLVLAERFPFFVRSKPTTATTPPPPRHSEPPRVLFPSTFPNTLLLDGLTLSPGCSAGFAPRTDRLRRPLSRSPTASFPLSAMAQVKPLLHGSKFSACTVFLFEVRSNAPPRKLLRWTPEVVFGAAANYINAFCHDTYFA